VLDLTPGCEVYVVRVHRTVKQTASRVGLPSRTIRYYDRIGLVRPERSDSGYRFYGPEDEGKLQFIRRAKALGFSLQEIRSLIEAAERGCCGEVAPEVERLLNERVAAIDARMADLAAFRAKLVAYREGRGEAVAATATALSAVASTMCP